MDAVVLDHVDKAYTTYGTDIVLTGETRPSRTRQVLRDLSLTIPAGEITVIVGRSGCGKSTLLKLLAGTEMPDTGTIRIPEGWHSAMLSPDPYVITWTSVQRNVAMACGVGKTPEERYERASEFVRLVGLEDYADLTPVELSTGMKQRLGIAIALAGDPDFLVLDEPVNGLDPQGIVEMRELILKLNREKQITVLISSHILDELSRLATHYGIIDNGRMVKELSAEELDTVCRKCVRMEVTDTSTLARVLDSMNLEYKIISATTADVFAKINVTQLTVVLAKENCEVLSMQEKDESLESYYISLVGGDNNA